MKIAEFDNVHRAYVAGTDVLAGVSFAMESGQIVALLGKNGAGKTTLIRIAMGMIEAQEGSVRIFGLDPRVEAVEVKRRVGYVSEEQILPPFLRVRDVVELHRGLFPTWDDELARRLGEQFAIDPGKRIKHEDPEDASPSASPWLSGSGPVAPCPRPSRWCRSRQLSGQRRSAARSRAQGSRGGGRPPSTGAAPGGASTSASPAG